MLLQSTIVALASSLVFEALASPVTVEHTGIRMKREVPPSHSLHERHLDRWSQEWTKRSKVPDTQVLPMRIGLKQRNIEAGHDKLMDISTPGSANYGKHMTAEEVIDFFAPHPSTSDVVMDWIVSSGISPDRVTVSTNKQWVQFDATTVEAEQLLIADFFLWEHVSGARDISTQDYHVPTHIQEHIDYITPGTRLRQRSAKTSRAKGLDRRGSVTPVAVPLEGFPYPNSSTCDTYVTAECTRVQYNIPNGTKAAPGNELGIFENLDVHYSRADLDVYYSTLYPHIPNGTYPEERLIDGAIGAIEDTTEFVPIKLEAPLDFCSSQPLIYPQTLVLFQEDDEYYESNAQFIGFWNTFLDAIDGSYCNYSAYGETGDCTRPECLDPVYPNPNPGGYKGELQCGVYKPTNVISISYSADESTLPDSYLKRQCDEWMKLALQGSTIVMSSGDEGVGDSNLGDFRFCNGEAGDIFEIAFASTCPYILSVGGTELVRFDKSIPPTPGEKLQEIATTSYPSSGGFSNVFGIPSYQRGAVADYFDQVESKLEFDSYDQFVKDGNFSNVTSGVYHRNGRGYPDVSAVGNRQLIYANGSWWVDGGTSLSAPVWGAMLSLINEERLAEGKSTVGFINPILYEHPEIFNDIVEGTNPGCGTNGFVGAKGWDPVTGLGTPDFPTLMKVLMSL